VPNDQPERVARNEALFRDVNERTKEISESLIPDQPSFVLEIFCECGELDCTAKLALPTSDYERVRDRPEQFVVAAGHEIAQVESVVDRRDGYVVVAKNGQAGTVARRTDPRS
jgi:hypothetical protein